MSFRYTLFAFLALLASVGFAIVSESRGEGADEDIDSGVHAEFLELMQTFGSRMHGGTESDHKMLQRLTHEHPRQIAKLILTYAEMTIRRVDRTFKPGDVDFKWWVVAAGALPSVESEECLTSLFRDLHQELFVADVLFARLNVGEVHEALGEDAYVTVNALMFCRNLLLRRLTEVKSPEVVAEAIQMMESGLTARTNAAKYLISQAKSSPEAREYLDSQLAAPHSWLRQSGLMSLGGTEAAELVSDPDLN